MSALRILMYSNDSNSWGNTSRTLAIAGVLSKALDYCSILVLTDLSNIGRFKLPERTDYVHLPALNARENQSFSPAGLNLELENTLRIRRKIAQGTLKTFHPNLVILDDSLLDVPYEMKKIMSCINDDLPEARVVWCLPDTLGEPAWVRHKWQANGVLEAWEQHADAILVFGDSHIFDAAAAYQVPPALAQKFFYTGYLARPAAPPQRVRADIARLNRTLPTVVLAAGGTTGDYQMMDAYLRFLEGESDLPLQSFVFIGPAINTREKKALRHRAQRLRSVKLHRADKHMLHYFRFADLVISTGSYNAVCEVLAHRRPAIIVPNLKEQPENHFRARFLQERGLARVIPPAEFLPDTLRAEVPHLLFGGPRLVQRAQYDAIPLSGFANTLEKVRSLLGQHRPLALIAAS